jgi:hypothetical protein
MMLNTRNDRTERLYTPAYIRFVLSEANTPYICDFPIIFPSLYSRKNVILSDCLCEQEICSSDYTQNAAEPVYKTVSRHLQQAMVPGQHLVSVHLLNGEAYEQAMAAATADDSGP